MIVIKMDKYFFIDESTIEYVERLCCSFISCQESFACAASLPVPAIYFGHSFDLDPGTILEVALGLFSEVPNSCLR